MAIHISLSQPAFALVTFCTSGASVVSCSVLFGGNYKLKNFSPWLRAVTRKHILPPLTCFLLEVIAGCVIISPLHSTYTVVQSHMTGVSLHLDLCCVSLCVVRWHLWYKMCWDIKTSLLLYHQIKCGFFLNAATSYFFSFEWNLSYQSWQHGSHIQLQDGRCSSLQQQEFELYLRTK